MSKKSSSVKITGTKEVREKLFKFLNEQIKEPQVLESLGKEAADQVRKRTQAGLEEYKQKPLSEVTIEVRKLLSSVNGEGEFFNPKRSNLTMSGQLLKAITHTVKAATAQIVISLNDYRYRTFPLSKAEAEVQRKTFSKSYQKQKAKEGQGDPTKHIALNIASKKPEEKGNKEIKKDLEAQGRKFLFISKDLNSLLQSKLAQELRRRLTLYKKLSRK